METQGGRSGDAKLLVIGALTGQRDAIELTVGEMFAIVFEEERSSIPRLVAHRPQLVLIDEVCLRELPGQWPAQGRWARPSSEGSYLTTLREAFGHDVPIVVIATRFADAARTSTLLDQGASDVLPRQFFAAGGATGGPRRSNVAPRFARELIRGRLLSLLRGANDLHEARGRFTRTHRLSRLATWELDLDTNQFRWGDEVAATFGIPASVPNGGLSALLRWVHPDDQPRVTATMLERARHRIEYRLVLPTGHAVTVRQEAELLDSGSRHAKARLHGVTQDITALREAEGQVTQLAYFDGLTELPNRAMLRRFLERAFADDGARRSVAVLAVDLDGFKRVNDSLGHAAGDSLLREVSARLLDSIVEAGLEPALASTEEALGREAMISRLGGDEFAIAIERPELAAAVATRVGDALSRRFTVSATDVFISASIGIARSAEDASSVDELLEHADVALYHAKEQGRDNYQFFTSSLVERSRRRMIVETGLRRAMTRAGLETVLETPTPPAQGPVTPRSTRFRRVTPSQIAARTSELFLVYQPKVEMPSQRVVGAEALMRWVSPDHGFVSPAEFIPVAEDAGLIVGLGEWALHEACTQAMTYPHGPLKVSVNVSMRQFREPGFVGVVRRALDESGLPPTSLELELTEGVVMHDPKNSRAILRDLKTLGVNIALDDFGTGYSSLSYLAELPIDVIKIDRSFVLGLGRVEKTTMITTAIIGLSRALGIDLVVEGVETADQLGFLSSFMPITIQGYLFAKPMKFDQLVDFEPALSIDERHRTFERKSGMCPPLALASGDD